MSDQGPHTVVQQLARWLSATDLRDLPAVVREDARWRLVDQVGVCIAGSRSDSAAAMRRVADRFGGNPQASVIGFRTRLPAPLAGLVNGVAGHAADFDDMHGGAAVHISSVAVPAALAAAETVGASGAQCLTAMVLGAEVALRIATGAPPHQFHKRGLHGTGVAGPFAAAAIASRLLQLDGARAAQALGMAGSRSSGLMQTLVDGSWVKQLHPGWAVEGGLTCAWLAAEGFTGPAEVVEGQFGLLKALLHGDEETFRIDRITAGLGDRWLLAETTFKPWPNGVWNHASMEGTKILMDRERLSADNIERIDCDVPPVCIPIVCEPREAKLSPRSVYHMKFSLPYSVAMLAVLGVVRVDDYSPATLDNPEIRALARRVHCHSDPEMQPETFPARVRLATKSGEVFTVDVPAQLGSAQNPMSVDDHRSKFRGNVETSLGEAATERLLSELENAWGASAVGDLVALSRSSALAPG